MMHHAAPICIPIIALLMACPASSLAQAAPGERAPVDAGAIIMPPKTDPGAVTRPPENADPKAIDRPPNRGSPGLTEKPPTGAEPRAAVKGRKMDGAGGRQPGKTQNRNEATAVTREESKEDDCRGPADLCKQQSPR
ncbi:hypothetical protein [Noviherbaspirillum saxi]|uniref:Uncharacterized protein n=1 Tax=Noviherbaspirillum saxi TaxID=2320863 RepID=A0A3A3FKE7_9BURK|nr:hypothetical protein [Noviherbaspirillum saxi]RJF95664.1 hypothetical protein D3871_19985 [Noviherbaspirillum saxi]